MKMVKCETLKVENGQRYLRVLVEFYMIRKNDGYPI